MKKLLLAASLVLPLGACIGTGDDADPMSSTSTSSTSSLIAPETPLQSSTSSDAIIALNDAEADHAHR